MQCPHCQAQLTYKQRSGRRCRSCSQKFVLEPKTSPLKMSDLGLQKQAARLSNNGSLAYTSTQLYYAMARKAQRSRTTRLFGFLFSIVGRIVITAIVSIIALAVSESLLISFVCGVLVAGIFLLMTGRELMRWSASGLPMSQEQFQREVLKRWQDIYHAPPQGMIVDAADPPAIQPAPDQLRAVLACNDQAVLRCLRANDVPRRLGVALVPASPPLTAPEQALVDTMRRRQLPLLLFHDASVAGCLMAVQARPFFRLAAGHPLLDLGLLPRHAIKHGLIVLKAQVQPEQLQQLRQQGTLSAEELAWLEQGRYTPIAAVPPQRLLRAIEQAIGRATPAAVPAQQAARAIGFMSWPEH